MHALTRTVLPPRVYVSLLITPSTTRLQVVQRSLSGGFLTEDAALLNANACSMFDEGRHHVLGGSPLTRALPAQGGQEEHQPSHPEAGCERWEVA